MYFLTACLIVVVLSAGADRGLYHGTLRGGSRRFCPHSARQSLRWCYYSLTVFKVSRRSVPSQRPISSCLLSPSLAVRSLALLSDCPTTSSHDWQHPFEGWPSC